MATRITQASFTRGELTPRLDSRTNLEQYAIGLKRAKNGIIHQEGGISNRMGLEYCGTAKYNDKHTRMIKFVFNFEQTYMLEFGEKYIRILKDGAYVLYPEGHENEYEMVEVETPYLAKDLKHIKRSQAGDVLTLTHPDYPVQHLCRYDHHDWKIEPAIFEPNIQPPTALKAEWTGKTDSNTRKYQYLVTSVDEKSSEESKRSEIVEVTAHREASWLADEYMTITWEPVEGACEYNIYRSVNGIFGYIGTSEETEDAIMLHNNIAFTIVETTDAYTSFKLDSDKVFYVEGELAVDKIVYTNKELTEYYGMCTALTNTSSDKKITIKKRGLCFVDDCIEPDLSSSAPVSKNPFADGNNPSCSAYFQQRKMYGNSTENPQTLWSSQSGAINNFNVSRPLIATDAVTLNMDDREVNEIRHIIPSKDLIVLTSNSEWKVNGTDGIFQANPMPAATIQSCYGSSHVEPVVSGAMIIFVQAGGAVIRDLGWDELSQGYDGDELSLFSSHLFEGKEIAYMAYAKEPYRLLFVVFTDGTSAVMTYNKKQKLCGWATFETDGKIESADVVREGMEDVVYFVINRTINGENIKFIERTRTRIIDDARDAFLVDCGLSQDFDEPTLTVSGLDHLEGKTVIANVNGGVVPNLVVKDGKIQLQKPASTIIVGLPYEFEFETLNIEGENTQGLKKVINYVSVKVYKSREDFIFCGDNNQNFRHIRCDESINNSGKLFSKDLAMTILTMPATDATIKLKQDYPIPLTILSVSATVDVQDNENN